MKIVFFFNFNINFCLYIVFATKMEFRETLLAAQRNQQQKSSASSYYKARFDPPKKEQKQKDRLSANIQKFLAKKDEEERQKKLEAQRKREELLAMRDPKALRKIQKTLKVIKSANKSVIEDAVDRDNTAVTREGPDQPDQDDYGYESQEAAAIYEKMMQKYSKIPDEPKFPVATKQVKKDLNGTRERVKHALQHEDDPVPHKRKRRKENGETVDRDSSPPTKYEPEKRKDEKPEKPKIRKQLPPPMDFNQLLKLAEQKKCEPLDGVPKKAQTESEPERLMTKKQKKEYEEELARRQRRQERLEAEKGERRRGKDKPPERVEKPSEKVEKPEGRGFNRIPKLSDKLSSSRNNSPKPPDRGRERSEREKIDKSQMEREKLRLEKERERIDKERLDLLKAERERIDRDIERLNKDRDKLEKTKLKLQSLPNRSMEKLKPTSKEQNLKQEVKKNIDLKSQNTYRIDTNSNDKKSVYPHKNGENKMNGHSSASGKSVPKIAKVPQNNSAKDLPAQAKRPNGVQTSNKDTTRKPEDRKPGGSKPSASNSFDFDKHINSVFKTGQKPIVGNGARGPQGQLTGGSRKLNSEDVKRMQKRRVVPSDSEYDSEMDDFIDDGDENMDYSKHIKEIFGYDRSRYKNMDDDDDPTMESSFARQQREEFISKKIGIMEDLEDMRLEAMEKKKTKNKRRISDD